MRGDILGLERRRRWTAEDMLKIVLFVGVDRATVTQVAQRHDITRQQIYAWRHALMKAGLLRPATGAVLLSLDMPTSFCARLRTKPLLLRPCQTSSPSSGVRAVGAACASTAPSMEPR